MGSVSWETELPWELSPIIVLVSESLSDSTTESTSSSNLVIVVVPSLLWTSLSNLTFLPSWLDQVL